MPKPIDVCIRGAGVVGSSLALLLAQQRLKVALCQTQAPVVDTADDVRAYALNAASRQLLESLRCWPDAAHATPVTQMQVMAEQGGAIRFLAAEQQVQALTWIVDVPALESRLSDAIGFQAGITRHVAPVPAPLTVVCEGKTSSTRAELGVTYATQPYAQAALAVRIETSRAHGGVARQWFQGDGGSGAILALLPLGGAQGSSYAVVWSLPPAVAAERVRASKAVLAADLEAVCGSQTGPVCVTSMAQSWPLMQASASQWCGSLTSMNPSQPAAWALAGDAAHTVHPLAGQGLNLGLGDASTLARLLHERDYWRPLNDLRTLRRYERNRKAAVAGMAGAMDAMQQLFTRPEPGLAQLRNWGLNTVDRAPLIKNWLVRHAMGT
jgi:2-polyprenyl-6-methoxyphenol hydroxylase-like FAD-dependent oxidoreductase